MEQIAEIVPPATPGMEIVRPLCESPALTGTRWMTDAEWLAACRHRFETGAVWRRQFYREQIAESEAEFGIVPESSLRFRAAGVQAVIIVPRQYGTCY